MKTKKARDNWGPFRIVADKVNAAPVLRIVAEVKGAGHTDEQRRKMLRQIITTYNSVIKTFAVQASDASRKRRARQIKTFVKLGEHYTDEVDKLFPKDAWPDAANHNYQSGLAALHARGRTPDDVYVAVRLLSDLAKDMQEASRSRSKVWSGKPDGEWVTSLIENAWFLMCIS